MTKAYLLNHDGQKVGAIDVDADNAPAVVFVHGDAETAQAVFIADEGPGPTGTAFYQDERGAITIQASDFRQAQRDLEAEKPEADPEPAQVRNLDGSDVQRSEDGTVPPAPAKPE